MPCYVSGCMIGRLTATPLMTVCDRMRAGRYGPTFRRGRSVYAELEAVEAFEGIRFSDAQVERAADRKPARILIILDPDEKEATHGLAEAQA